MLKLNTIHRLDCIEAMSQIDAGCVDLAFADPPFNIGYKYDVYDDKKDVNAYLDWSRQWISGVHRVLKPTGTFWLAIGDDFAAELKVLSQQVGFYCRSWVVWYYTFGVNCKKKFSRSHTHVFHFVKDPVNFQFNGKDIAVPSARQLVYADSRAAKGGRLPDDTWILRPQDLTDGFNPDEDVWYFPRVAGTFKEREGFHGCQMPEQLLGRIVKASSSPGDLVLDPFSGSSTTLTVARKLDRQYIGFEISEEYVARGLARLAACEPGDPLDGSPEPTVSAPATPTDGSKKGILLKKPKVERGLNFETSARETPSQPAVSIGLPPANDRKQFDAAVIKAFRQSCRGYSADRVVADPELDQQFLAACAKIGLDAPQFVLNRAVFRLRKAGRLQSVPTEQRTDFAWEEADDYLFASEIAWRQIHERSHASLDDILCNPALADQFDQIARKFAPGYSSLQYRWGALKLRKVSNIAGHRSNRLSQVRLPASWLCHDQQRLSELDDQPGLYMVYEKEGRPLYAGETFDLGKRLKNHFGSGSKGRGWTDLGSDLRISAVPYGAFRNIDAASGRAGLATWLVACQYLLVKQESPKLNSLVLDLVAV